MQGKEAFSVLARNITHHGVHGVHGVCTERASPFSIFNSPFSIFEGRLGGFLASAYLLQAGQAGTPLLSLGSNQKSKIVNRYSIFCESFAFLASRCRVSLAELPPTPEGAGLPRKMQRCGVRHSKEGQPFAIESAESTKYVPGNHQNFLNLPRAVSKAGTGKDMLFDYALRLRSGQRLAAWAPRAADFQLSL